MKINILAPFTFFHANGDVEKFVAGVVDVAEDIASHWYVKHHSDPDFVAADDVTAPKRRGRPARTPNDQEVAAPSSDADAAPADQIAAAQVQPADGAQ